MTDALAIFERLIAASDGIERKGKALPYASLNGNMFAFIAGDGAVALRLSKADRAPFLRAHDDAVAVQHGSEMKDDVRVVAAVLVDDATLQSVEPAASRTRAG